MAPGACDRESVRGTVRRASFVPVVFEEAVMCAIGLLLRPHILAKAVRWSRFSGCGRLLFCRFDRACNPKFWYNIAYYLKWGSRVVMAAKRYNRLRFVAFAL